MLKRDGCHFDALSVIMYERMVPFDHLLVKIDKVFDFEFVYEMLKDKYSTRGRGSKDPAMMLKICLLEYIYNLSDGSVVDRIRTDAAFRWFLGMSIDDEIPDDTTISHFRVHRLGSEGVSRLFNEVVRECMAKDLIGKARYIVDSTNVEANANYPSVKKLVRKAYDNTIKLLEYHDFELASSLKRDFDEELHMEHEANQNLELDRYLAISRKHLDKLYLGAHHIISDSVRLSDAFVILHDIIDGYENNSKDKIISVTDPDSRVAIKVRHTRKCGYKNHILVDEKSELIIASTQTPVNVLDHKQLDALLEQVKKEFELIPIEITGDKGYSTSEVRGSIMDRKIIANINFPDERSNDIGVFGVDDFKVSKDMTYATCPNRKKSIEIRKYKPSGDAVSMLRFFFDKLDCEKCKFKQFCIQRNKAGKYKSTKRILITVTRIDAVQRDKKRNKLPAFSEALRKRWKVERRFAFEVRKFGLRRSRYLRMSGAKIHITLSNTACNILRAINLIFDPCRSRARKLADEGC
jgi:transposase